MTALGWLFLVLALALGAAVLGLLVWLVLVIVGGVVYRRAQEGVSKAWDGNGWGE